MKKIIATTTINSSTGVLEKHLRENPDWEIVVAGDLKTPSSDYVGTKGLHFLDIEYQQKKYPKLSDLIGWNCIQRRNFAILEALELGADIVALIDDDNVPLDSWGEALLVGRSLKNVKQFEGNHVFDPIYCSGINSEVWHRGFPLEMVPDRKNVIATTTGDFIPDIQVDFWNGDPDVDAIGRWLYRPYFQFCPENFPFCVKGYAPFNSQNTFFSRNVFVDYFLFPHIGRMDDIWASYYCEARGHRAIFCEPSVQSNRDLGQQGRYSLENDFTKEILGYQKTSTLLEFLTEDPDRIQELLPSKSWLAFQEYRKVLEKIL